MIKSLRLKNFKAFEDTGVIQLKPMTVLAGPNSGGEKFDPSEPTASEANSGRATGVGLEPGREIHAVFRIQ